MLFQKIIRWTKFEKLDLYIIFIFWSIYVLILLCKLNIFNIYVPDWDESHHLSMGYYYFDAFFDAFVNHNTLFLKKLFFSSQQIYPPLFHIQIALNFQIFGVHPNSAVYLNILYLLIFMYSIYKLGSITYSRKVGIISAVLIPTLPVFLRLQEFIYLDFVNISLFIFIFYLLFRTDFFKNRKYAIYFGVLILVNLLIKWPFLLPCVPFGIYFVDSYLKSKNKRVIISNLIKIILICSISLFWYFPNFYHIRRILMFFSDPNNFPQIIWNKPAGLNLRNFSYYLIECPLSNCGITFIPLVYNFWGVIKKNKTNTKKKYFIMSILITYITLTIMRDKEPKYIAYIYPLLLIIAFGEIYNLKNIYVRYLNIFILSLSIITNFIFLHINFPEYKSINIKINKFEIPIFITYPTRFTKEEWPTEKIIVKNLKNVKTDENLLVLSDHQYVNHVNVRYFIVTNKIPITVFTGHQIYNPINNEDFNFDLLANYKYILTKSHSFGVFVNHNKVENINKYLSKTNKFKKIDYELNPDKSYLILYENQLQNIER